MYNHADKRPRHTKKQRKEEEASVSLSSLPLDVALSCLSCLSRLECTALSLVSKTYRSLVVSPELRLTRSLMGCTEEFYYVCLTIPPHPAPRWFVLRRGGKTLNDDAAKKSVNRRLRRIPSHPCQPPESSSFVVLDHGIYIIGGIIKGSPTSCVLLLDCLSHTWHRVRSMRVARASPAANVVDGKIYVFGGCVEFSNWGEVFDPKTQTWDTLPIPEFPVNRWMIENSVVMEKKIYAVVEKQQTLYYLPSEGKLLYCFTSRGRILWCEPDELDWKEVKGLDAVDWSKYGLAANNGAQDAKLACKLQMILYGFCKLSSNSRGNIVVFWKVHYPDDDITERLELWCAEISLDRRKGGEVWGKIEWADVVSQLGPRSFTVKVWCSVSVNL
ncbi:hypothetical protein EUTSA_v10027538mg [Eutrema salsugineum]|uniref:F-box domain-containing protein n=1 Tax=Eutrema salsugineum TaxID=72664 RepID=V4P5R3_EUTSA|nr:hypothetical protein EUTSA_v10027538mg [Eutrema salsugineum]